MKQTCNDCKFMRVKYDTANHMCCKKSPEPGDKNVKAYWPFVNPGIPDYDWCGDFQPKGK